MTARLCTTCPYCGVGCGVTAGRDAETGMLSIVGDHAHPANAGRLCVKGSALGDTLATSQRLLQPQIGSRTVSWDTALDHVAGHLGRALSEYGPESVAFYVSGQLLTEDYYVANKLMKGFIGGANIDTNSRLCMSSAVAAHKRILGSDSVPGNYEDLELADLVVITGSNMAWTHPVVYQRIMAARESRPQMKLVVIDPRRTATAASADLHLALKPGTDGRLFDGLFAWLVNQGATDDEYISRSTEGFAAAAGASVARSGDPRAVAAACGLERESLTRFYQWFAATERTVTVFSQGINQSVRGVDHASAILQCHLACGRIGKPGAGPFSITGQPNAMGGREVGGLANQLAAHMELENEAHRALVARFWGVDSVPAQAGLKAVDLFEAMEAGRIRFIWVLGTNPVVSMPDADAVRRALARCECVVVSDCVADTDTLRLADVRLPALAWGEKEGTVTNSERMISRQRAFLPEPGAARPDWWALSAVARRLGFAAAFSYRSAAEIFREHAALSAFGNDGSRDFDIGALADLDDAAYAQLEPVQWPLPRGAVAGTPRLFGDGRYFTATGRARFLASELLPAPDLTTGQWPLLLNTGRSRDQWHTMTRSGRSTRLSRHMPEPVVELHPDDIAALGLAAGGLARVSSPRGSCVVRARAEAGQPAGTAFMPIHWNDCFASSARVGALIAPTRDPVSGQPAFKQSAVRVTPVPVRWQAVLIVRDRLPLPLNDYWCRREADGWQIFTLAGNASVTAAALKALWSPMVGQWVELEDSDQVYQRLLGYNGAELVCWFALAPELPEIDEAWLLLALAEGRELPLALAQARPVAGGDSSPTVCSCHQVREGAIRAAIGAGADTAVAVGRATRAGTNCGSCLPEIRQLIASCEPLEAPC